MGFSWIWGGGIFNIYPEGTRGLTGPKEGVILETAQSCVSRTTYMQVGASAAQGADSATQDSSSCR